MKRVHAVVLSALLALPLAAQAQSRQSGFSYSYGEGRLVMIDPDGGDNYSGVKVGGSLQFLPQFFGIASLSLLSNDPFDLTTLEGGAGFRHPIRRGIDVLGTATIQIVEIDGPGGFSDDDTGISLTGGIRAAMTPQLELGGYLNYAETFGDGDVTLTGEGLLHMTRELSLVGSVGLSDDANTLTLGARWNFPALGSAR
ncbi:MAG: outer membrane beta-barrel protein [Nevskiaceae bacterium]